jgi:FdhD protein
MPAAWNERHNAVDKVVGWAVTQNLLPLTGMVLMVSGRASFELTQKASMAGIPMLAAVSAPSSLAVDLATELGVTSVGFLRGASMVVYSRPDRLGEPDPDFEHFSLNAPPLNTPHPCP